MAKVNSSLLAGLNESLLEKTKETNKVVFYLEVNS